MIRSRGAPMNIESTMNSVRLATAAAMLIAIGCNSQPLSPPTGEMGTSPSYDLSIAQIPPMDMASSGQCNGGACADGGCAWGSAGAGVSACNRGGGLVCRQSPPPPPGSGCTLCGASWVALESDFSNCGACGRSCAGGQQCLNSVCTSYCQSGLVCASSTCAVACPAGQTACGGACFVNAECTDLTTDDRNCGACGAACLVGQTCSNGACAPCGGGNGQLQWWYTCGGPGPCGMHYPSNLPACTNQMVGAQCSTAGTMCDPGNSCNSYIVCTTGDPTKCRFGCPQ
jgi:hypothetical protein